MELWTVHVLGVFGPCALEVMEGVLRAWERLSVLAFRRIVFIQMRFGHEVAEKISL